MRASQKAWSDFVRCNMADDRDDSNSSQAFFVALHNNRVTMCANFAEMIIFQWVILRFARQTASAPGDFRAEFVLCNMSH